VLEKGEALGNPQGLEAVHVGADAGAQGKGRLLLGGQEESGNATAVKAGFDEFRKRRVQLLGLVEKEDEALGKAEPQALKEDFPAQCPLDGKLLRFGQGVEI
jgi:hypothetical protein